MRIVHPIPIISGGYSNLINIEYCYPFVNQILIGLFIYVSSQEGEVYINDTFYVPLKLSVAVKVTDFELYMPKIQSLIMPFTCFDLSRFI